MKAVIFGLGGVLIDSEEHWQEDQRDYFKSLKSDWSKEDQAHTIGADIHELHRYLMSKDIRISFEDLKEKYDELDARVYGKECSLYPGVLDKLIELKARYKLAIVTSTRRKNLDLVMGRFNLHEIFDVALSTDDVSASKPQPNAYLHFARQLGISPRECIVVEDSDHGINSAREAGMPSIGVRGTPGQKLKRAQLIVDGVKDIKAGMIEDPHGGL